MTTGNAALQGSRLGSVRSVFTGLFDDGTPNVKARLIGLYAILAALNVGAWIWALAVFHDKPALLGIALLVYGFGLRHAVDADHIAAIDNVTRKLMGENKRPLSVGFFFAMGHSAVVVLVAAAVAGAATMLGTFESLGQAGGTISTIISATFLFAIAAMNVAVFLSVWKSYRMVRAGGAYVDEDIDILLNNRGFLTRLLRPLFRLVSKSWHMFPLGFLFGLGFDTATEVAMFGLSAAQAAEGVPLHAILVFPFLFAAGMSLVDTTDGIMMLRAYDWALVEPARKLRYNMTITLVSALVAISIGGIEALRLIGNALELSGGAWDGLSVLADNFNALGFAIIATFLALWLASRLIHSFGECRTTDAFRGRVS